jgi:hypothetical protein
MCLLLCRKWVFYKPATNHPSYGVTAHVFLATLNARHDSIRHIGLLE